MFNEMNKKATRTVNESINTKELPWTKLKEFIGRDIQIFGYFFTNGDYGKQLVCVSEDYLINMPNRYVRQFEDFDDDIKNGIVNGGLTLSNIREYVSKTGRKTVTFDFMDSEVLPF